MRDTDWHVVKDPRMKGPNLITCPHDASRCIIGEILFEEAVSDDAVAVLRQTVCGFGMPVRFPE